MEQDIVKDLAKMLSNYFNTRKNDNELLANLITNDHRTLQQLTFNFMMICISKWAKAYEDGRYDLRNEYTCKKSYEIMKSLNNEIPRGAII